MKKNNLIRKVKQGAAGLLTAAMVLTGAPLGSMSVMAATTLQDNSELDPSSPIGANDGITRVNELAGGIHKAGDYTTYGQSQGAVYRFGKSGASSNYKGKNPWGGGTFTIQGNENVAIAEDNANLHGTTFVGSNGHQYTFDIGAILDSAAVPGDPRKTFKALDVNDNYKASKSAFGANWWATYIGFGQTGEHKEANPADTMPVISPRDIKYDTDGFSYPSPGASNNQSDTATPPDHGVMGLYNDDLGSNISKGNGRVVEVKIPQKYVDYVNAKYGAGTASSNDKIEVRMEVKPTADKQKLLIVWTGYNPNNYPVEFWIGAQSDSQVAGTDVAPTIVTADHTRLHMMDYYNQNLYKKDKGKKYHKLMELIK